MSEAKKLYRSETEKIVGGVCGGLGQYLGVDPVLVRLVFLAMGLINGLGVVVYMIMWLVVPSEANPELRSEDVFQANIEEMGEKAKSFGSSLKNAPQGGILIGGILIMLGAMFLLDDVIPGLNPAIIWPVGLIAVGLFLLLSRRQG